MSASASTSSSSGCRSPRPGATATRPPIARCSAGCAARGHACCSSSATCPGTRRNRDLPDPDFCDSRSTTGWPIVARPFRRGHRRGRCGDRRLLRARTASPSLDCVLATARGAVAFYDIDTPDHARRARGGDRGLHRAGGRSRGFDAYFSFTGGPTLARLEREYGARRAAPLYCAVDAERLPPDRRRAALATSATSAPTAPTGSRRWSGC